MEINLLKKLAAEKAVEEIRSGMVLGLGSGSTMQFALERLGEKLNNGDLTNIIGIPSSENTEREASRLGIPLTTLNDRFKVQNIELRNEHSYMPHLKLDSNSKTVCIDLAIDGADEADENMNLIKGGGGALLREKVVAQASKRLIIILDETKISKFLGEKFFIPVEVLQYAQEVEENFLRSIGAKTTVRKNSDGKTYITDEGNIIIDANFGMIREPEKLSRLLEQRAGIVEHGIFSSELVEKIFCAYKDGIKIIER